MSVLKQELTWAGFKGSHTISYALFVARAETDSVAKGSCDVRVAKRHHLEHLLDLRLQVSQHLLQRSAAFHLGINTQQSCPALTNIHVDILRVMKILFSIGCIFILSYLLSLV